ncbi:probable glucan endo-1,3-beta-glucosidase A6 [Zea mays]|uniref:Putative glucan endo-13-beta-glucosidase A6 n=1 Tax=Zea mays TaxID=4577 RepID=A0A1D6EHD6_MAIZE|nr:probable glucan endo-1,3-beta-glucosidase A6 [Zea mays]ONM19538.1 putative glucan endo-13-beta-glucosidase A6 [Zea mays]|eukprot:XP_008669802.1 probable glucan endo-1,3-beta-glucosidase A6 [Zea mays]
MAVSQLHLVVMVILVSAVASAPAVAAQYLGVNYGTLGDNLPPPHRGMELARSAGAVSVRFYDANATLLAAAAASGLDFVPSFPNELIPSLAGSQRAADALVAATLLPFRGNPRLRYLFVGNEFLSNPTAKPNWALIVPAMTNAARALRRHGLAHVKVSTTLSMNDLGNTVLPPSAGAFRPEIAEAVMGPMLAFLQRTGSCLFLDAYTYFTWSANHTIFPLPYALLEPSPGFAYHDPGTGLSYANLLDQMLDTAAAAMCRLGYCGVGLALAETGWPTAGDLDQFGANVRNAATYNRNLARRLASGAGTPRRPGVPVPAMVFALFNEDLKWGPDTERHWGLFYPNGSAVYEVDLTGRRPLASYPPLPPATNDQPYRGPLWCVVRTAGINETAVREQVAAVCDDDEAEDALCDPVRPGGACFLPNTVAAHASYVFSAHWNRFSEDYGACYFDGWGMETTIDPSHGSCKFPSIHLK